MKKLLTKILVLGLALFITACGEKIPMAMQSEDDFTPVKVVSLTSPKNMISANGPFSCVSNTLREGVKDEYSVSYVFTRNAEGIYEYNQRIDYADGASYNLYYNSDAQDPYYYLSNPGGTERYGKNEEMRDSANYSIFGYEADDVKIASVTKEAGTYEVVVETYVDGELSETDTLYFEEESGKLRKANLHYESDDGAGGRYSVDNVIEFMYHSKLDADVSPKKDYEKAHAGAGESEGLSFSTVDIDGNAVTSEILKGSKLVLLNLWEPWCGPCVNEMPDLEKLYENYKGQGLLILGVYTTYEMDEDAKDIVTSQKITYPILKADSNLMIYEQNYVPASYLFDGEGKLLESEPIQGARSYEAWESIISRYLSE